MEDGSQLSTQCKLCSAQRNLISLLAGKGRETRDLIRKIIYVTTGIEFQEGDRVGYICLTCVVHIYNFYIFQHRSLENAERLRVLAEDAYQPVSKKKILDLGDIILPDISDLKDVIVPWFNKKRELFFEQKYDADSGKFSESQDSTTSQGKYDQVKMSAKAVQCNELELISMSRQTCYKTVALQCNINKNLQNKSVQTILNAKNKKVQCEENLESNLSNMDLKNSQCRACNKTNNEVVLKSKMRYDEFIPIKKKAINQSVQCNFFKNNSLHNILNNDIQYKVLQSRSNGDKITSDKLSIKISPNKNDSNKSKNLEYVHQGIQCELIEVADKEVQHDSEVTHKTGRKRKTALEETSTQTKISVIPKMYCEDEKLTFMVNVKDELTSPTLSPNKSLHITTESLCKIESAYSPTERSQNSKATVLTDLLAIKRRVDYVKVCSRCDQILASKSEAMKHKKKHMICPYCKKSFTSIKKTNIHKEQECDKKIKTVLKIHLEPLEFSKDRQFRTNVLPQNNVKISESIPLKPPPKKIKLSR